jgi:hypothetical protein
MNKIYEEQLKIARQKISLSESGPWKRKQRPTENPRPPQDPFAHYKPTKKEEPQKTPEEPKSELSDYTGADMAWDAASLVDPTGAVDLANAVRYGLKGNWLDASLSALGAIPVVGNLATAGKIARSATKVAKAGSKIDDVKMAKRLYMTTDQADAYAKASGVTKQASKSKLTADEARAAAERIKARRTRIATPTSVPAKGTALSKLGRTATAAGAGAVIANALQQALKNNRYDDDGGDDKRESSNDSIPDIGINIHRLSVGDPGDPSGYVKATHPGSQGREQGYMGYHPYLTAPLNIDLHRRRSPYSIQRGLPESIENNLKLKIKKSINNYLKSREGEKLDNHLNQVRMILN